MFVAETCLFLNYTRQDCLRFDCGLLCGFLLSVTFLLLEYCLCKNAIVAVVIVANVFIDLLVIAMIA